jgi:hypothetical protein
MAWAATAIVTLALFGLALRPRWKFFAAGGIAAIVIVELFVAGLGLDLNRPNLPETFSSSRPAATFFATDTSLYRTLASSDNTFDPGDMAEMKAMLAPVLSNDRIYDYIVAAKHKETLTPNLTMVYGIPSLDGYDGGVLPLKRYAEFKSIFQLRKGDANAERFREQLNAVPATRLLSWLNVKYVLMDRVHDVWTDGVYYDLSVEQRLANGQDLTLDHLKSFDTTSIGIISTLENGASIPQGADVASVTITDADGSSYSTTLKAGVATAEGQFEQSAPAHQKVRAVAHPKGEDKTNLYIAKLMLPATGHPKSITIHCSVPTGQLRVRGLSMIDDRLGISEPVPVDNNLRLAYLGDVKIYENLAVMPRAFLVNTVKLVGSDEEALSTLKAANFQPNREAVVLSKDWQKAYPTVASGFGNPNSNADAVGEVKIESYESEKVVLSTSNAQRSFLVLTDSYYPGWHVKVDGQEQPILPTNYLFRGVALEAGQHKVEFSYEPNSFRLGLLLSAVCALVVIGIGFVSWRGSLRFWN